jgi:hypothetical protein
MQFRKFTFSLAGLVVAIGALTVTLPRAAHAVASALVQVTNGASNPVITQDISQQATQMVHLYCTGAPGIVPYCSAFGSNGAALSTNNSYTVPSNQYLVITSDLTASYAPIAGASDGPCPATSYATLEATLAAQSFNINGWTLAINAPTTHFVYPPGMTVGPGMQLSGLTTSTSVKCGVIAEIYGYLTSN